MILHPYNRQRALEYAEEWAMGRNPAFLNFDALGGDCTNFVSQCLLAGSGVMNYTTTFGWYYISGNNRTPSWTGVHYFHKFLTTNKGLGPVGSQVPLEQIEPGDIIQLGNREKGFYHTLLVTGLTALDHLVSAHSVDVHKRPLTDYEPEMIRCIHIDGVRKHEHEA